MRLRIICSYFDPSPRTHRLWETLSSLKKMQRPTRAGSVSAEGSGLSAAPFQELGLQCRGSGWLAQGGRTWGDDCPGWGDAGPLAQAGGTALGPVTAWLLPVPLQLPGPSNHLDDSQHWGLHLSLDYQFVKHPIASENRCLVKVDAIHKLK